MAAWKEIESAALSVVEKVAKLVERMVDERVVMTVAMKVEGMVAMTDVKKAVH